MKRKRPSDPSEQEKRSGRRQFLKEAAYASIGVGGAGLAGGLAAAPESEKRSVPLLPNADRLPDRGRPIKLFCCDFNFCRFEKPISYFGPSAPQDWAFVNPREYFEWHRNFGVNIMFGEGYTFCGYAFYPTKLGPVAPGPGRHFFPELFRLARQAGLPFCGYFNCSMDLTMNNLRRRWVVPRSHQYKWATPDTWMPLLAPESPWGDLFCARLDEFLRLYPVEWINFDGFGYGGLHTNDFPVQPAWFVKKPFAEIIGRAMPDDPAKITPEESLKYKREIMARFFYRIRDTMHKASPETKAFFNVPFFKPAEPMWVDHPMLNESDMLVAESSDEIVGWLLKIRKPGQRVMTTIIGRPDGVCDPNTWKKWYKAGCDFFGYAWGTPPDFRPNPMYANGLKIVKSAFAQMP